MAKIKKEDQNFLSGSLSLKISLCAILKTSKMRMKRERKRKRENMSKIKEMMIMMKITVIRKRKIYKKSLLLLLELKSRIKRFQLKLKAIKGVFTNLLLEQTKTSFKENRW